MKLANGKQARRIRAHRGRPGRQRHPRHQTIPALAFALCERRLAGASAERKWLIRHAVRYPAKSGVRAALRLRRLARQHGAQPPPAHRNSRWLKPPRHDARFLLPGREIDRPHLGCLGGSERAVDRRQALAF